MFEGIIGNVHIKKYLQNVVDTQVIGNSWLFSGTDSIGKSLFATEFAKLLYSQEEEAELHLMKIKSNNHPDIRHYRPKGKVGMHTIESMRQFNEEVYYRPFEAKRKIFIIHEAHRMMDEAANALLKTFEEPSEDSIIILLSSAKELILPTILSRCRTLHFYPIPENEIAYYLIDQLRCPSDEARLYAGLSDGSLGKAIQLFEKKGNPLRKKILDFMAKGRVSTYFELTDFLKEIVATVDQLKKEKEEAIEKACMQGVDVASLTAVQKHAYTKEIEGATALHLIEEAGCIFQMILAWFRDLHLLYLGADNHLLIHKDYEEEMQKKILVSEPPTLESIQQMVKDAKLSLQRSTTLMTCLENLFLKLNFI